MFTQCWSDCVYFNPRGFCIIASNVLINSKLLRGRDNRFISVKPEGEVNLPSSVLADGSTILLPVQRIYSKLILVKQYFIHGFRFWGGGVIFISGPHRNISAATRWLLVSFCTNIHVPR